LQQNIEEKECRCVCSLIGLCTRYILFVIFTIYETHSKKIVLTTIFNRRLIQTTGTSCIIIETYKTVESPINKEIFHKYQSRIVRDDTENIIRKENGIYSAEYSIMSAYRSEKQI
jgi:hypothetical protein